MGVIITIRHAMGLIGPDDGGLASALRNVGQLERYGAIVAEDPIERLGQQTNAAEPDALPDDLRS